MSEINMCEKCKGHGCIIHRITRDEDDLSYEKHDTRCYECMGSGVVPENYCGFCKAIHKKNFHAQIEWIMNSDVIAVFDQNKGARSVTNDVRYIVWLIENNLSDLTNGKFEIELFPRWRLIYRDSDGYFDEICLDNNGTVFFQALTVQGKRTKELNEAFKIVSKNAIAL